MKSSGVVQRAAAAPQQPRGDRAGRGKMYPGAWPLAKVLAHRQAHRRDSEAAYRHAWNALWNALEASPHRPVPAIDEYGHLSHGLDWAWRFRVMYSLVGLAVLDVVS